MKGSAPCSKYVCKYVWQQDTVYDYTMFWRRFYDSM